jgi:glycosyltransferase involved in cell wall biosynthesis
MKISIVMPTYNSEKYIKQSIDSIINQEYQNWELLIFDNCSDDNTVDIIGNYLNFDHRIKLCVEKDAGVAEALNKGFKKTTGEILCWLNSDDLYVSKFVFSDIAKTFNQYSPYFIASNFFNIDHKNIIIKTFYSFLPRKKIKNIFYYNQIFTGAFFFKKDCFEKFKNFNINYKYAFEYEFIIFLLKNYIGLYVDNFYAAFRILPNSLSSNKNLLENEKKNIFSSCNLIYSNNIYLRISSYFFLGILLKVFINSIFDKNKNKNIIDYYSK